MSDEVDLHYDIVAKVPLEITEMILQYLPICQVFRAQRVSRRWREILASPRMVTNLLRSWYPDSDTPSNVPDELSAKTAISLNAEHVDAYKSGRAFILKVSAFRDFTDGLNCDIIAYADGLVAWTDAAECCICRSLDLKSGNTLSFITEDRSPIRHLALSSSMIAAMSTSGKCYLWTFQEQKSMSLRMPSARVKKVMLSKNSLVVAFYPRLTEDGALVEIITWTLNSQRTYSFSLSLNGNDLNSLETKLLLDEKGESVILLERSLDGCIEYIRFTRANLTGVIRAQGVAEAPLSNSHEDVTRTTILAQSNQFATLWAFLGEFGNDEGSLEFVRVRYDFDRDRLDFDTRLIKGFGRSDPMSDFFFFKDVAYYRQYCGQSLLLRVVDFDQSICSEAPMSTLISHRDSWLQDRLITFYKIADHCESLLFGDENFLLNVFHGGIMVWNFDKNVTMVAENRLYRIARG